MIASGSEELASRVESINSVEWCPGRRPYIHEKVLNMVGKKDFQKLAKEVAALNHDFPNVARRMSSLAAKFECTQTAAEALSDIKLAVIEDPDRARGIEVRAGPTEAAAIRSAEAKKRHEKWLVMRDEIRSKPGHGNRTDWFISDLIANEIGYARRTVYNVLRKHIAKS